MFTRVDAGNMSERSEARLTRCPASDENALGQRTGRSPTVQNSERAVPLREQTHEPILHATGGGLPGSSVSGRGTSSVSQLRYSRNARSMRRAVVSAIAAVTALVAASLVVPAYAQTPIAPVVEVAPVQAEDAQEFAAAPSAALAPIERDNYTVTELFVVQWPTVNHFKISDGFGARVAPCAGCSTNHAGVDFDAGWGANVTAMAAGVVVDVNNPMYATLGNHIVIRHEIRGQTITSVYGHMQDGSITVKVGDKVTVGQLIGLVGSTGASTGPHLHFEIHINGVPVNPVYWLSAHVR